MSLQKRGCWFGPGFTFLDVDVGGQRSWTFELSFVLALKPMR